MHKFSPDNALRLERPERYAQIQPDKTLKMLGLRQGMTMVDIGAGTGFFTRPASTIVGPNGKVYATDMSADMLDHLRQHGVPANVEVLQSGEYALPLPDATADVSLVAFVLHETPDLVRFLKEIDRVTKPSGAVAIIDWKKQTEELGPPEEERLDRQCLLDLLKDHFATIHAGDLNASHYYVLIHRTAR
jgi:ubiquinone/menaquinone biosynthesis C-methylase UbiE